MLYKINGLTLGFKNSNPPHKPPSKINFKLNTMKISAIKMMYYLQYSTTSTILVQSLLLISISYETYVY
jgi:hypothetical protein